jgi:hypothetical protein
MILSQTEKAVHFAGYSFCYPLDPYMVLSPTRGAAGGDGFLVQPFGYDSTGETDSCVIGLVLDGWPPQLLCILSLVDPCRNFMRPMSCKTL